jgi:DNA-binding CsgD family transcriptional regulator
MNKDLEWVFELIDRCYSAATNDEEWPSLLGNINTFLDGHGATLFFTDAQLRPIDRFFGDNVSPESISDYQAYFHKIDIRMHRAGPGALNSIVTDTDLVDEDIVQKHEFYQDFLRPIGHRFVVSAMMDLGDGSAAFLSSHRGLDQDHADSEILDRANLLLPHLRRGLQLRRRLFQANGQGQAALELLYSLGQALFLIDSEGRIIWQNASADRLLQQQDGLSTSEGELRASAAAANSGLQRLIRSAITALGQPRKRPGGMMTIPRLSMKRSYHVLVTPLSASAEPILSPQSTSAPSAAVFIMDLERNPVPPVMVLRSLYNLTPAEGRLAMAIGSGESLKAYAERNELSIHYVRWLLKQVEAKTETRRLADLIRLLASQANLFVPPASNEKENKKFSNPP